MKRYILLLITIALGMYSQAQEYKVESFEIAPKDLSARTEGRVDGNGRKCAVIKVYVKDAITDTDGPVIGEIRDRGMEKWIYVSHDAKQIGLLFKGHMPLQIRFSDYDYPSLTGEMTYVLKLKDTVESNISPTSDKEYGKVSSTNISTDMQNSYVSSSSASFSHDVLRQEDFSSLSYTHKPNDFKKVDINDYFIKGSDYFKNRKYYPEAYEAFMTFGDIGLSKNKLKEEIYTAYFNAGLAAYSGNAIEKSADAFKKARAAGYEKPEAWIYGIACWQNIASKNPNRKSEADKNIFEIACSGYDKFRMTQPLFINNIVAEYTQKKDFDSALKIIDYALKTNPDNSILYGLRGYVYDKLGDDDKSVKEYIRVSSMSGVDFETLLNAGKKIYKTGVDKYNAIVGNTLEANEERKRIKKEYFEKAKNIALKAKAMDASNSDLIYLIDSINNSLKM